MTVQYGFAQPELIRAFYSGTDTLYEGYCLCYDNDTTYNSDNEIEATDLAVGNTNKTRNFRVEKPAAGNMYAFAGVVAPESAGMTGPGIVTLIKPGSPANVYAKLSSTINSSRMTVTCGQYYMSLAGFPGTGSALCLQTVDRSTTAGLIQALLDSGPQSGGYGLATAIDNDAMEAGPLAILNGCGSVLIPAITLGTGNCTATLADGLFEGQKKVIACGTITTSVVDITITHHSWPFDLTLDDSATPVRTLTGTAAGGAAEHVFLQAATEGVLLVWSAALASWIQLANTADVA